MALPALLAARADAIVVAAWLAPLLSLTPLTARIVPLRRGVRGMLPAATRIRRGQFARGVLLTSSFSSALLFRMSGVRSVRGAATDARERLLNDVVPRSAIDALHRSVAYHLLVTGEPLPDVPLPHLEIPEAAQVAWRQVWGQPGQGSGRVVGVIPGSHASSRAWPAARYAAVARALAAEGMRVVVFGSAAERALTRVVAGDWAFDAGGRTDLPTLAAALASCDILITNDSGPMHLGAAAGVPTLALWGAGNPAVTGVAGACHRMLRRTDLPCVPCVKNECPRHGAGFILDNAERECLTLIEAVDVLRAAHEALAP